MEFTNTDHDFGTINEGDVVEYTYAFKNTGAAPLIIQSAQGSCGCTVPDWTKEPIPVGATGFVKAKFDSNGKTNIQNKTVTVTANTWPKQTVLRFKAMVTPKSTADGPVKNSLEKKTYRIPICHRQVGMFVLIEITLTSK
jgi:hypothetical protein